MWFSWTNHRWARMGNTLPLRQGMSSVAYKCWTCPRTVLGHTCELRWLDVQKISEGCSKTVLGRPSRHQVTLAYREVPGLSWDVPHGIFRTPSHICIQGCARTVMVCPSWDFPGVSQHMIIPFVPDSPRHSIMSGQSSDVSLDCSKMSWTLVGNTGHDWLFMVVLPWTAVTIMQAALISKWWISTKATNFNIGDKFSTKKKNFTINWIR